MPIEFLRPVGSAADVKELEYVSALLQTEMPDLRADGSIKDVDIVRFLKSRYGIEVTASEVRKTVMFGLGGGDGDDVCIDLMEMVAILLIPTLIKAAVAAKEDPGGGLGPNDERASLDEFSNERECRPQQRRRRRELRPHRDLLRYVLEMILLDVTGSSEPRRLDRALLQCIFVSYGETELSEDEALLNQMIAAARGDRRDPHPPGTGTGDLVLDVGTFARALTGDVRLYDETNETKVTTNYYDVFKTYRSSHEADADAEGGAKGEVDALDANLRGTATSVSCLGLEPSGSDMTLPPTTLNRFWSSVVVHRARVEMRPVRKTFNASAIDFAAGTCRSEMIAATLWAAFMVGYFAYVYGFVTTSEEYYRVCPDEVENRGLAFGCRFLISTIHWFVVFFIAWVGGLTFIGLGSIGNDIESESWWKPLAGMVVVLMYNIIPVYVLNISGNRSSKPEDRLLFISYTILGFVVTFLQFLNFIGRCCKFDADSRLGRFFVPSGIASEAAIKRAAAHKMNMMTKNALDLSTVKERDIVVDSHFGQALIAFSKLGEKFERAGGLLWTWKRWRDGDLFTKEGIWFHARLLAGNAAMVFVAVYVLVKGIRLTKVAGEEFDTGQVSDVYTHVTDGFLSSHLTVSEVIIEEAAAKVRGVVDDLLASSCGVDSYSQEVQFLGFDDVGIEQVMGDALGTAAEEAKEDFYPAERYMVVAPLAVGTCFAFLAAVGLIIIYIPSVTSTTLQLRSGVIPTFHDPQFSRHRDNAELVTILLGSMFWGTLFSSFAVGGLIGALVFALVWQVTEPYVLRYLAFLAGITVLVIFRIVLFYFVRTSFYDAFYRRRPALVNVSALALEAANFAISVGFIIVRAVKLLVTSALYIGRIDTPFLAPGVGNLWGKFELDNYPTIFMKDILAHEAHRHPYLEIMGVMFMMKLRYGDNFGKTAGSGWRLIFVFALMPWLSKYRVMKRPETRSDWAGDAEPGESEIDEPTLRTMSLVAPVRNRHSFFMTAGKPRNSFLTRLFQEHEKSPIDKEKSWLESENARLVKENAELKQILQQANQRESVVSICLDRASFAKV